MAKTPSIHSSASRPTSQHHHHDHQHHHSHYERSVDEDGTVREKTVVEIVKDPTLPVTAAEGGERGGGKKKGKERQRARKETVDEGDQVVQEIVETTTTKVQAIRPTSLLNPQPSDILPNPPAVPGSPAPSHHSHHPEVVVNVTIPAPAPVPITIPVPPPVIAPPAPSPLPPHAIPLPPSIAPSIAPAQSANMQLPGILKAPPPPVGLVVADDMPEATAVGDIGPGQGGEEVVTQVVTTTTTTRRPASPPEIPLAGLPAVQAGIVLPPMGIDYVQNDPTYHPPPLPPSPSPPPAPLTDPNQTQRVIETTTVETITFPSASPPKKEKGFLKGLFGKSSALPAGSESVDTGAAIRGGGTTLGVGGVRMREGSGVSGLKGGIRPIPYGQSCHPARRAEG